MTCLGSNSLWKGWASDTAGSLAPSPSSRLLWEQVAPFISEQICVPTGSPALPAASPVMVLALVLTVGGYQICLGNVPKCTCLLPAPLVG